MLKKIFFPIEILSRELDSKLLLITHLLSNSNSNWEVFIGSGKKLGKYYSTHSKIPFIYFEKGIEYNTTKLKNIIYNNGRTVILDEEGGVYTKSHKNFPRGGFNNPSIDFIEKIFFWGEDSINIWKKNHKNLKSSQICLTGNPRFDLSKKKFNKYFLNTDDETYKDKFILVSSAFGSSNGMVKSGKKMNNYWKSISFGKEYMLHDEISNYQSKLFPLYIEGITSLIKENPNEMFLIRPHPAEKLDTYSKIFEKYKNVIITNKGPVQNYLPYSKIMIHNGCTTAIEAFAQELNPICYSPYVDDEHSQFLTFVASDVVNNISDLHEIFKKKLELIDNPYRYEKSKKISEFIFNIAKVHSYELISRELDELNFYESDIKLNLREKIKNHLPKNLLYFLKSLRYHILTNKKIKNIKKDLDNKNKSKFPDISKEEIVNKINILKNIINSEKNFQIIELEKNIFHIK